MKKGLIHLYYGDGKGKTTAAAGLALRCIGAGMNVCMAQFLKGPGSSEVKALETFPNFTYIGAEAPCKFVFQMDETEKRAFKQIQSGILNACIEHAPGTALLILDEVVDAYNLDMIDRDALIRFLKDRPEGTEIVMTGHNPPGQLIEAADYVSEIIKIKHPFDIGVHARKGIEL